MNIFKEKNSNINESRIFGLDIIRTIAILIVVIVHGRIVLKDTRFRKFPDIRLIDGVDLFFVLSGFLIGGILIREINSKKKFGLRETVGFWKRRWLRTLPNYYLILLVNYIIVYYKIIIVDINQFNWKFLFFLQNFKASFYGFFEESWSLSIEEWFYILFPIILIIALRFLTPKKAFIFVTILMLILPFINRTLSIDKSIIEWNDWDNTFRKIVVMRLDSIAYGLLASWILYYYNDYWVKLNKLFLALGICLIAFILWYRPGNDTFYRQVAFLSLVPISVMFFLPFAHSIKAGKGIVANCITHLSKISYSMYLINLALVAEVIRDKFTPITENAAIRYYVFYWVIVISVSTILYRYFEKPIMDLRNKKTKINFTYGQVAK